LVNVARRDVVAGPLHAVDPLLAAETGAESGPGSVGRTRREIRSGGGREDAEAIAALVVKPPGQKALRTGCAQASQRCFQWSPIFPPPGENFRGVGGDPGDRPEGRPVETNQARAAGSRSKGGGSKRHRVMTAGKPFHFKTPRSSLADAMMTRFLALGCAGLLLAALPPTLRAQEDPEEEPSAELIIDAEETLLEDPMLDVDEDPLPPLGEDTFFPGEEDIFGADLFGGFGMNYTEVVVEPIVPDRPPLIEDPKELERKQRIKLRRLSAVLKRDPQLLELEQLADQARTPEDRRAARRAYYALFYDKVRTTEPELSGYVDKLERASLVPLYQTRVEPTMAMNPPPQPQPQPQFIPQPVFPPADLIVEDFGSLP
jgi:hypothetical protein